MVPTRQRAVMRCARCYRARTKNLAVLGWRGTRKLVLLAKRFRCKKVAKDFQKGLNDDVHLFNNGQGRLSLLPRRV